jgi:hypothetical protein
MSTPDTIGKSENRYLLAIVLSNRLKSRTGIFHIHLSVPVGLFSISQACWHYFCLASANELTSDSVSGREEG